MAKSTVAFWLMAIAWPQDVALETMEISEKASMMVASRSSRIC